MRSGDLLNKSEESTLVLDTELPRGGVGFAVAENKNGKGHSR